MSPKGYPCPRCARPILIPEPGEPDPRGAKGQYSDCPNCSRFPPAPLQLPDEPTDSVGVAVASGVKRKPLPDWARWVLVFPAAVIGVLVGIVGAFLLGLLDPQDMMPDLLAYPLSFAAAGWLAIAFAEFAGPPAARFTARHAIGGIAAFWMAMGVIQAITIGNYVVAVGFAGGVVGAVLRGFLYTER